MIMRRHKWKTAVLFYEKNGHHNVGGMHTCYMLMTSVVDQFMEYNFTYESFATDSAPGTSAEHLRRVVGLEHSSEYIVLPYVFVGYTAIRIRIHLLN